MIPTPVTKALLRTLGLDRITKSPRALLEMLAADVRYDSSGADELLPSLGIEACPPFETYVDALVEYVQDRVRRRRASKKADDVEDPLG